MSAVLERVIHRDRLIVASALVLVSLTAWAWLLSGAGMGMSAFEMTRHSAASMDLPATPAWTPPYLALMFAMWWIMMIAMMLPSATPAIMLAAALNRRSNAERPPFGPTAFFAGGYLLVWGSFSGAAVATQWALQQNGWINSMLVSQNRVLNGLLVLLAGLWQFSPWKHACLRHCRSPVEFLTRYRRPGWRGALSMGVQHGAYCLGCCWFLMSLLFVGGVMNLYWIIGLALYVWVEKVLPGGHQWALRLMGAGLSVWGTYLLLSVL